MYGVSVGQGLASRVGGPSEGRPRTSADVEDNVRMVFTAQGEAAAWVVAKGRERERERE